jgi:glycosidase
VTKVEPPDWPRPDHAITLRLLLTGTGLTGASVTPCNSGIAASRLAASADGSYLFLDLAIPAHVRQGPCALGVSTPQGEASAPFAIAPALEPGRRFQGFSPDDLIYLIMPDRFANGDPANDDPAVSRGLFDRTQSHYYHGGDLAGVQQRLTYLKDLGVTAIWLTPVYDNVNHLNGRERDHGEAVTDYHGYGAVDFYAVEEHFGTLDSFRDLVDAAHRLGIRVIQDEVANHTGPYNPWVKDSPTPQWFNGTERDHLDETWQTWTLEDPHATPALQASTLEGWFANILPDLNQRDPEVSRYLIQNTLWWIGRTGIDGIREDTVPYVPRTFWSAWTRAIHENYPKVRVVGEVFDSDPALTSFYQGGREGFDGIDTGIDSVFDFPLESAIRRVFAAHASPSELARVIAHDRLYPDASRLVTFLGNHDMARFMNEPGATMDDLARAFTFLFSVRGTPLIYYGDEIGMAGGNDPDNRRDFPGGWREDARSAFEQSGRTPEENRLFDHVRRLGEVRRRSEALRRGAQVDLLASDHAYAFARVAGGAGAIAIVHDGPAPETLSLPVSALHWLDGVRLNDALGSLPPVTVAHGRLEIQAPARAALLYVTR